MRRRDPPARIPLGRWSCQIQAPGDRATRRRALWEQQVERTKRRLKPDAAAPEIAEFLEIRDDLLRVRAAAGAQAGFALHAAAEAGRLRFLPPKGIDPAAGDVRVKARGREGRWGRIIAMLLLALLPIVGGAAMAWRVRGGADLPLAALGSVGAVLGGLLPGYFDSVTVFIVFAGCALFSALVLLPHWNSRPAS